MLTIELRNGSETRPGGMQQSRGWRSEGFIRGSGMGMTEPIIEGEAQE